MNKFIFLVLVVIIGCDYNHVKRVENKGVPMNAQQMRVPDFKAIRSLLLETKCIGCHSDKVAKGGVNLERYAQVRAALNRLAFRVLEKQDMPPDRPVSAQEAQLLMNWIDMGAPEKSDVNFEKPNPDLERGPTDWPKVRDKIFAIKCLDCHSAAMPDTRPDANLDLTSLIEVRAKASIIFDRIILKQDMPLAPYPAVSPSERKVLLKWFDSGMPE